MLEQTKGKTQCFLFVPVPASICLCGPGQDKGKITDLYPFAVNTGSMWHQAVTSAWSIRRGGLGFALQCGPASGGTCFVAAAWMPGGCISKHLLRAVITHHRGEPQSSSVFLPTLGPEHRWMETFKGSPSRS